MSLITYLTRIHFADGALEDALPEEARRLGTRRPLVVACAAAERAGALGRLLGALGGASGALHPAAAGAPTRAAVAAAREAYLHAGCDGIVGLGGGAAIDLARALGGAAGPPVIAVPASFETVGLGPLGAGWGAFGPARAAPDLILCDPTLAGAGGPAETAAAGFDALSHCVEAYLSAAFNPPADGIALEGVRLAAAALPRAAGRRRDLAARRTLLAAVLNAGLAAQKGLGAAEAAARGIEAVAPGAAPHGRFHAALLPHVLGLNAPAAGARFAALGGALGARAGDPAEALAGLGRRLGLPDGIGSLGLGAAALAAAARAAAADPANGTNPRHATEADYLRLLAGAA